MQNNSEHKQQENDVRSLNESRFVSYINSMLHFNSINYDKKKRKDNERYSLILDDAECDQVQYENLIISDFSDNLKLEDQINDLNLYREFMNLTKREREVVNLAVYHEMSDTKIAGILKITQQSVSKTKKKALEKLRSAFNKEGEYS